MKTTNQIVLYELINVAQDVFNYNVQFYYNKQNSWTLQQILSEPFSPNKPETMPEIVTIKANDFICKLDPKQVFSVLKQWARLEKLPKNFEFINKSEFIKIDTFGVENFTEKKDTYRPQFNYVMFDPANGVVFATDSISAKIKFIPQKAGSKTFLLHPVTNKRVETDDFLKVANIQPIIFNEGLKITIPEKLIKSALTIGKKSDVFFDIAPDKIQVKIISQDHVFEYNTAQNENFISGIIQLNENQLKQIKIEKLTEFYYRNGILLSVKNDFIYIFMSQFNTENLSRPISEGTPEKIIYPERPAPVQAETVKRKTRKVNKFTFKTKNVYFTPTAPETEPIHIRKYNFSILYKIAALFALVFILSYQTTGTGQTMQEITLNEVICTAPAPVYCLVLPEIVCTASTPVKEIVLQKIVCTAPAPEIERVEQINKLQPEIATLIVDGINVPTSVSNVLNSTGTPSVSNPGANILNYNLVTSINLQP